MFEKFLLLKEKGIILEQELVEIGELGFIYPIDPEILNSNKGDENGIGVRKSYIDLSTIKTNSKGDNIEHFYDNVYELIKINRVTDNKKIFRFMEIITQNFKFQTSELGKEAWQKLIFELGFPKNIPKELLPKKEEKEVDIYEGGVHARVKSSICKI